MLHGTIRDKVTGLVDHACTRKTVAEMVLWFAEHGVSFDLVTMHKDGEFSYGR